MRSPRTRRILAAVLSGTFACGVVMPTVAGEHKHDHDHKHGKQTKHDGDNHRGHGEHNHKKHGKHLKHRVARALFDDIDLSKEQKQKVHDIYKQHRAKRMKWFKENRDRMRSLRKEWHDARKEDREEAIKKVRKKFRQLRNDAPDWEPAIDAVRQALDEDQTAQFNKNLEKFQKRMKKFKKHMKKRKWGHHDKREDCRDDDRKRHHRHHKNDQDDDRGERHWDQRKREHDDEQRDRNDRRSKRLKRMLGDVDLYEEQREEIYSLIEDHAGRKSVDAKYGRQAWTLRRKVRAARHEDDYESAVEYYEKLADLYRKAAKYQQKQGDKSELMEKIRSRLTEQQQRQFDKKLDASSED